MFWRLMFNEIIKIYIRPKTWIMIAIMLSCLVLNSLIINIKPVPNNWKKEVMIRINEFTLLYKTNIFKKEQLKKITKVLAILNYRLKNNLPNNAKEMVHENNGEKYYRQNAQFSIFITLLASITATDSIASEFTYGTIKLLLIRPVSRYMILFTKYFNSILFAIILLIILIIYTIISAPLAVGVEQATQTHLSYINMKIHTTDWIIFLIKTQIYEMVSIILITTLSFMLATLFRSPTLTITLITILSLLAKPMLSFINQTSWSWITKYIVFNYLDSQIYENGPSSMALCVVFTYYTLFVLISAISFKKRDIL